MANQKVAIGRIDSDLELTLQERGSVTTAAVELVNADGNQVNLPSGLVPENFDYIELSYSGTELVGVVYKTGGSGGTTVATLTLTYDSSSNLATVTKT